MIGAAISLLYFLVAVAEADGQLALAHEDDCVNEDAFLMGFHWSLVCAAVATGTVPLTCDDVGALCAVSCGYCNTERVPQCGPMDIYRNEINLLNFLHDLGLCSDCQASFVPANEMVYVRKPPFQSGDAGGSDEGPSGGYTASSHPRDPCLHAGVTCDRCGNLRDIALGVFGPVEIPGYVSETVFRLHRLATMFMVSSLALSEDAPFLPGEAWANLHNLTILATSGVMRGEFPELYMSKTVGVIRIETADLIGNVMNLVGSPAMRLMAVESSAVRFDGVISTEIYPRMCDMVLLDVLQIAAVPRMFQGRIPDCWWRLDRVSVIALNVEDITGPVELVLNSPRLTYVQMDRFYRDGGGGLTGTLPAGMSELTELTHLSMRYSSVHGRVPDLSRLSNLKDMDLSYNQLTGGVGPIAGSAANVVLDHNAFRTFPDAWLSLPGVFSLSLAGNAISSWPAAGVYGRGSVRADGTFAACGRYPSVPALDWPEIRSLNLASNSMNGVDVRDVLGSLASIPNLQVVDISSCGLTGDLPNEGSLVPQVNPETCRVATSFRSLVTLQASNNSIQGIHAGPWSLQLQQVDFSNNNLMHVHADWFNAPITSQNYRSNPGLRLDVEASSSQTRCGDERFTNTSLTSLVADPDGFTTVISPSPGWSECTSLCIRESFIEVDVTVQESAMCRCVAGWYGDGTTCNITMQDFWSFAGAAQPVPCPANSSTLGLEGQVAEIGCKCNAGFFASLTSAQELVCVPCPVNTARSAAGAQSVAECQPCEAGAESALDGRSCSRCKVGFEAAGGKGSGCRACSPGQFAEVEGLTSCKSCPFGQYQDSAGASACEPCTLEGTTTWSLEISEDGTYTPMQGAPSAEHCGCEPGRRQTWSGCQVCGVDESEGLHCPGGISDDVVLLLPGFYSDGPEISVFRCWGDAERCPGYRRPGDACAEGRTGLLCAVCEDGKTPSDEGTCRTCTSLNAAIFPLVLILTIGVVVLLYCVMYIETHRPVLTIGFALMATSVFSLVVATSQQLVVISQLAVKWFDPLRNIIDVLSVLAFDVEWLKIGCVADMDPLEVFIMRLLAIFIGILLVVIVHVVAVVVRFKCDFHHHNNTLISAIGTLMTAFYLAVVTTIIGPMQCQTHPNGQLTSRAYPSIRCWESDTHRLMVTIALVFVMIPLAYLAGVCWVVKQHPMKLNCGDTSFLKTYRFLVVRFQPKAYWFAAVVTIRSMLLSLAVVAPNLFFGMVMAQFILLLSFFLTATLQPWRSGFANHLDVVLTMGMIVIMNLGHQERQSRQDAQQALSVVFGAAICSILVLVPVVLLTRLLWLTVRPLKKFRFFLCHYKAQAGAFARLMKTALAEGSKPHSAFLDCDDLEDLNNLFTHVSRDTRTLVVLNSGGILFRPWCAGEITTAHSNSVEVLPVRMPDYKRITEEQLDEYPDLVDIACLTESGISMAALRNSLQWYEDRPGLFYQTNLSKEFVAELVSKIVHTEVPKLAAPLEVRAKETLLTVTGTVILVDHLHQEVVATALVLEKMMTKSIIADESLPMAQPWTIAEGMAKIPEESAHAVFMFSRGCLQTTLFLALLGNAADRNMLAVPVFGQDTFRVPSKADLEKIQVKLGNGSGTFVHYLSAMFKTIAKLFDAPYGSATVLQIVADIVVDRLRRHVQQAVRSNQWSMGPDDSTISRETTPASEAEEAASRLAQSEDNASAAGEEDSNCLDKALREGTFGPYELLHV